MSNDNPLDNPRTISLSPEELTLIRPLATPAYNSIITGIDGNTFRTKVYSIINVSRLTEIAYNYIGTIAGGVKVISSDKRVWVVPHRHETVLIKYPK